MREIKLPFGQDAIGRMIHIDAAERGLACNCFCPECREPLVAVKGDILQHHFRHYSEACEHAAETALHLFAKQCIAAYPQALQLPHHSGRGLWLPNPLGKATGAKSEYRLPSGLIPDIHIDFDSGETLAVEVWVAHQVPLTKVEIYNEDNQTTLEIDLRRYRHARKTEEQWRHAILQGAPRYWLCLPKARREEIAQAFAARLAAEDALMKRLRRQSIVREMEAIEAQRAYEKLLAEHAEKAKQEEERQRLEAIRSQARRQAQEIEWQKQRVEAARLDAERKHAQDVLEDRLRREMTPPSLQDMVEAHGSYPAITPEAWAEYDDAMATWQSQHAEGVFWTPPYLALQKQKQDAYWRQKMPKPNLILNIKKGS